MSTVRYKDFDLSHKVGIIPLKSVTSESRKMSSESYLTSGLTHYRGQLLAFLLVLNQPLHSARLEKTAL